MTSNQMVNRYDGAERDGGLRHVDDRFVVLPFYLLCDVSYSMQPHIGALNEALREFRDSLAKDPILGDKVQFGVIDFSDNAREVIPLSDFSVADLEHHQLSERNGTSYAAAFKEQRRVIERDLKAGAQRYRFFRPAVFFLTDGAPNHGDAWKEAFRELTHYDEQTNDGFRSYPLFVPFGIGAADVSVLSQLVHPQKRSVLFMANQGTSPTDAIKQMTDAMLKSVVSSGRTALIGTPQHQLPTQRELGPGVTAYPGGDYVT
jgi:uncharacterized protein YegL